MEFGKKALDTPDDYEARANIMWASSWAINDTLKLGHMIQWSVHPIEHQLSAVYNMTHGVGLAILTPHWMEHVLCEETVDKFYELAVTIWKVPESEDKFAVAKEGIERLKKFYRTLGISEHLADFGIDETHFEAMAGKAAAQLATAYKPLTKEEVIEIYRESL